MKRIHPKWFLCGMLAAVGLFLIFCLPGYKFGGLFLLGLSALIPVYHFLKHDFLRRVLTALLALGFVVLSITGGVIARSAQGTEAAEADYLIVLGCQVNGTVPSLIPAKTEPLSLMIPWFLREILVLCPQLFT